jgi:hypothetical protein
MGTLHMHVALFELVAASQAVCTQQGAVTESLTMQQHIRLY